MSRADRGDAVVRAELDESWLQRVLHRRWRRTNSIVKENRLSGSSAWRRVPRARVAGDIQLEIKGFTGATSVNVGEQISFHVTVNPPQAFKIEVYRLGHYGGEGGRLVATSPMLDGTPQPAPRIDDATGLIHCDWPVGWTLTVPRRWVSGLYMAVLINESGKRSYAPFVVRDDARDAEFCALVPFATFQSFNKFPADKKTGRSLYHGYGDSGADDRERRAVKVSFDRPYALDGRPYGLDRVIDVIQWLERSGYDVTYASDLDLHANRIDPKRHAGIIVTGSALYWSRAMRDAAAAAVAGGTSLALFGANNVSWHVRFEPSADGRRDRVMVCYRTPDPSPDSNGPTVRWRALDPTAEQNLLGVQSNPAAAVPAPLVVKCADHWFWAGSGLHDGDTIDQMVDGLADGFSAKVGAPQGVTHTLLSASPYEAADGSTPTQATSLYETADGAIVFNAGTSAWGRALNHPDFVDYRIQTATANLLDRMTSRGTKARPFLRSTRRARSAPSQPQPATVFTATRATPKPHQPVRGLLTANRQTMTEWIRTTGPSVESNEGNVITAENVLAGSSGWRRDANTRVAGDFKLDIKGYTSAISVAPGERLDFHVTVNPPQAFRIEIYRLGFYGGHGGCLVATSPVLDGVSQPPVDVDDASGLISCNWPVAWSVTVPPQWTSGFYMTVFVNDAGRRSYVPFVVRDDTRSADFCVILPFTTYQAYNKFPSDKKTGRSLYHGYGPDGSDDQERRARKVSFDRPYALDGRPYNFQIDVDFVQWAERSGYDVVYATSLDLHAGRIDVTRYAGLIFSGHDEYWSRAMREAAEAAVASGTSLVFLGANNVYWHVRFEPSADGRPDRVMVCHRYVDPSPDTAGPTLRWRVINGGREAEQGLLGVQYNGIVAKPAPLVVQSADHWFWAGSGAQNGDAIDGLVAGEADGFDPKAPQPPGMVNHTLLSASPYPLSNGKTQIQNTSVYETANGAIVFDAGTFNWTKGLNDPTLADRRIQVATKNLLDRVASRRADRGAGRADKPARSAIADNSPPSVDKPASSVIKVISVDLAPDDCGWDIKKDDDYWRGRYYGDGTPPLAGIDLSEGYDDFMARVRDHAKGAALRNARKAADCTTEIFDYASWIPDIHAIHHSMPVRSGGPMQGHYLRSIEEMGGWPTELRPPETPRCINHWKLFWGIFAPVPGLVWDRQLVGYIAIKRLGNQASYVTIIGHGDWLNKGIMYRLHFDVVKWAMSDPLMAGCDVLWYTNFRGAEGVAQWKRSAGFREIIYK